MRRWLAVLLVLFSAGCGQVGDLTPKSAAAKPSAPYGRDQALSTGALLTPPPQAAPERSVELHTRSEPRPDDPFDLPPTGH